MRINLQKVFSGNYLNVRIATLFFLGTLLIGLIGFKQIEDLNWVDALYMTMITFSTVGFETVHEMSRNGKIFASFIIVLNIASFAYALSVFSYYFIEGKFFQKMKNDIIRKRIQRLSDHIIVCGMGRYGEEIIRNFMLHKMQFVIIEISEDRIEELQSLYPELLFIKEDATHDDVLLRAGINKASAFITALPDDSDNLFTVLSARQLNPNLKIISRAYEAKSIRKLKLAGADHVIMPEHIGGFYMATLVSKPDAVEFFTFITSESKADIGFEEINYEDLPDTFRGKTIRETMIRAHTGANIIGFKDSTGKYTANPDPETVFAPGSSFIFLGNTGQIQRLKVYIKGE
jgi:voltage-gated potassium channel